MRVHLLAVALLVVAASSCSLSDHRQSAAMNPFGYPGKAIGRVGFYAADSELPLLREAGRVVQSVGELFDAPALLVEGLVTLSPSRCVAAGEKVLVGVGGGVTSLLNLPLFFVSGGTLDIGREADAVNEALMYLDQVSPRAWGQSPSDPRCEVFPRGTRVRASGRNLIWVLPDGSEILQAAEVSPWFRLAQLVAGDHFLAQERSWGFVVGRSDAWFARSQRSRVITTLHEFYHQHEQLRRWFRGWTIFYWPAYGYTFATTGWRGHWAETAGSHAAEIADRALRGWRVASVRTSPRRPRWSVSKSP